MEVQLRLEYTYFMACASICSDIVVMGHGINLSRRMKYHCNLHCTIMYKRSPACIGDCTVDQIAFMDRYSVLLMRMKSEATAA